MKLENKLEPSIEELCKMVHILFNNQKEYRCEMIGDIPFKNGIYIIFEKGEHYYGYKRIVRVGTHKSLNRLQKRMKDHFIRMNKDGSIFRKNIGKALLNKDNDEYLSIWSLNTSQQKNRQFINKEKQKAIELSVSEYMKNNITFTVFDVEDTPIRMKLESALISLLNRSNDFHQSAEWLGNYSTEDKIRNSGMWLKQGLSSEPLTLEEFNFIEDSLRKNS